VSAFVEASVSEPLVILGAGAHARECGWLATDCAGTAQYDLVAFGTTSEPTQSQIDGIPVLRLDQIAARYPGAVYVCGVGDPATRRKIAEVADRFGLHPGHLKHPDARIAASATLGRGVVIFAGCVVSVSTIVGDHVHLNFNSTVSHDCVLGDFATLSPGVHVAGNVFVGAGALLGVGSSVKNGRPGAQLRVGARAVVGAGACVIRDVADDEVVVGVPAQPISGDDERPHS
jgi:sugar O-acyltransferase (sialic acid O-acetyltransferase NeuD family)